MRALLVALMLLCSPACAQDSGLRSLATSDAGRGWAAVGRLDLGAGRFCTATLIAADRVLTAAHCLFDSDTGAEIAPASITFLAGWRNGRAEVIRGIRRSAVAEGYGRPVAAGRRADLARVAWDVAILELDRPIRQPGVQPMPMATQRLRGGDAVAVVSYARDRAEAPALQDRCTALERRVDGVVVFSCDIDFGSSGAPVLVAGGDGPRIVSVISARAESGSNRVALGMEAAAVVATLNARLDAAPQGGARLTARFLRP